MYFAAENIKLGEWFRQNTHVNSPQKLSTGKSFPKFTQDLKKVIGMVVVYMLLMTEAGVEHEVGENLENGARNGDACNLWRVGYK